MTKVKFNNEISYYEIPYYDRFNWDLIDAIRKRDKTISNWEEIVHKLINKY